MSVKTDVVPFEVTMQVALRVLEGINTPRSLSIWFLAKSYLVDSYEPTLFASELDSLGFRTNDYDQFSVDAFRIDYCATALLTKLPSKEPSPALVAAALDSLDESERHNHQTAILWSNESKVEALLSDYFPNGKPLSELRKAFLTVMGRAPSVKRVLESSCFTGGASLMLNRRKACSASKCVSDISITPDLAKLLYSHREPRSSIFDLHPLWKENAKWFLSPGNLVSTVPKNIKTDRTIAMEAEINQFFQRGLGYLLNKRLRRFGIDLTDQGLNQRACMRARKYSLATVDFKNASNSIVARVVESVVPAGWWELLNASRSPYGTKDSRSSRQPKQWFEYHMMSSMGNGYTFELESVVFFATCLALDVPIYDIYVYGDDLIIPQADVSRVVAVLKVMGLQVNIEKSFTSGSFFESCGVYVFNDVDVTPFKIKDLLYGDKECIVLANKIRWFSHCSNGYSGCDRRMLSAYRYCCHRISSATYSKCRGPLDGSLTLWSNRSEVTMRYSRKRASAYTFQLSPVELNERRRLKSDHPGLLFFRLSEIQHDRPLDQVGLPLTRKRKGNFLRDDTSDSYHLIHYWVNHQIWYEPGDWS